MRIIEPVLAAMQIPYRVIEDPSDVRYIAGDIDAAYRTVTDIRFSVIAQVADRMKRDQTLEILKQHVSDEIVVAVYQTLFDWMVINPRDLNYVATGAMGQASSHALGLALANPDREVIVFDGDGSLLMNLGSLVTVADAAPRNLHHFVFENGVYEVNGAHPIPGQGPGRLRQHGRSRGLSTCYHVQQAGRIRGQRRRIPGPARPGFRGHEDRSGVKAIRATTPTSTAPRRVSVSDRL